MDIYVLDTNFRRIGMVENYESFLWTDRYAKYGDFEIYVSADQNYLEWILMDYYIQINTSDHLMIVESFKIETDVENGNKLSITGRSLESILLRRIIWTQTTVSGNVQNAIKTLLTNEIINPSIADRKISNFIFEDSTDTAVTSLTMSDAQYTGDNLYEVIKTICEVNHLGFKITLNSQFQFVFKLYAGKDRSYAQTTNPYVVFSPKFDNLISSDYTQDKKDYKNVTLIAGEGEGLERKTATYGSASGLDRRELFTDARDLSTNNGEISLSDYNNQLIERGTEKLTEYKIQQEIESEAETSTIYTLSKDFEIGDLVQVIDTFGTEAKSRIVEIVTSISTSEYTTYPTFEIEGDITQRGIDYE